MESEPEPGSADDSHDPNRRAGGDETNSQQSSKAVIVPAKSDETSAVVCGVNPAKAAAAGLPISATAAGTVGRASPAPDNPGSKVAPSAVETTVPRRIIKIHSKTKPGAVSVPAKGSRARPAIVPTGGERVSSNANDAKAAGTPTPTNGGRAPGTAGGANAAQDSSAPVIASKRKPSELVSSNVDSSKAACAPAPTNSDLMPGDTGSTPTKVPIRWPGVSVSDKAASASVAESPHSLAPLRSPSQSLQGSAGGCAGGADRVSLPTSSETVGKYSGATIVALSSSRDCASGKTLNTGAAKSSYTLLPINKGDISVNLSATKDSSTGVPSVSASGNTLNTGAAKTSYTLLPINKEQVSIHLSAANASSTGVPSVSASGNTLNTGAARTSYTLLPINKEPVSINLSAANANSTGVPSVSASSNTLDTGAAKTSYTLLPINKELVSINLSAAKDSSTIPSVSASGNTLNTGAARTSYTLLPINKEPVSINLSAAKDSSAVVPSVSASGNTRKSGAVKTGYRPSLRPISEEQVSIESGSLNATSSTLTILPISKPKPSECESGNAAAAKASYTLVPINREHVPVNSGSAAAAKTDSTIVPVRRSSVCDNGNVNAAKTSYTLVPLSRPADVPQNADSVAASKAGYTLAPIMNRERVAGDAGGAGTAPAPTSKEVGVGSAGAATKTLRKVANPNVLKRKLVSGSAGGAASRDGTPEKAAVGAESAPKAGAKTASVSGISVLGCGAVAITAGSKAVDGNAMNPQVVLQTLSVESMMQALHDGVPQQSVGRSGERPAGEEAGTKTEKAGATVSTSSSSRPSKRAAPTKVPRALAGRSEPDDVAPTRAATTAAKAPIKPRPAAVVDDGVRTAPPPLPQASAAQGPPQNGEMETDDVPPRKNNVFPRPRDVPPRKNDVFLQDDFSDSGSDAESISSAMTVKRISDADHSSPSSFESDVSISSAKTVKRHNSNSPPFLGFLTLSPAATSPPARPAADVPAAAANNERPISTKAHNKPTVRVTGLTDTELNIGPLAANESRPSVDSANSSCPSTNNKRKVLKKSGPPAKKSAPLMVPTNGSEPSPIESAPSTTCSTNDSRPPANGSKPSPIESRPWTDSANESRPSTNGTMKSSPSLNESEIMSEMYTDSSTGWTSADESCERSALREDEQLNERFADEADSGDQAGNDAANVVQPTPIPAPIQIPIPTPIPVKRKRGRPRKHPVVVPATNISTDMEQGYTILLNLISMDHEKVFFNPPDAKELGMSNYFLLVDKPMWLQEMQRKFLSGEYSAMPQFVKDVRLLVENCYRFNGEASRYTKQALRMEQVLEQRIALLSKEVRAACSLEATHGIRPEEAAHSTLQPWKSDAVEFESVLLRRVMAEEGERRQRNAVAAREERGRARLHEMEEVLKEEREAVEWEEKHVHCGSNVEDMHSMWELPQIAHFLMLGFDILNIDEVPLYELERMLIIPQTSRRLASVMTSLLSNLSTRAKIHTLPPMPYKMWTEKLGQQVAQWYRDYDKRGEHADSVGGIDPQFWEIVGKRNPLEEYRFEELSFQQRVWLLKGLCDYLFENQPLVTTRLGAQSYADDRTYRLLGADSEGNQYFYLRIFSEQDLRVYRHATPMADWRDRLHRHCEQERKLQVPATKGKPGRKTFGKRKLAKRRCANKPGVEEAPLTPDEVATSDPLCDGSPDTPGDPANPGRRPLHDSPGLRPDPKDFALVADTIDSLRALIVGFCGDDDEDSRPLRPSRTRQQVGGVCPDNLPPCEVKLVKALTKLLEDFEEASAGDALANAVKAVRYTMFKEWRAFHARPDDYVDPDYLEWQSQTAVPPPPPPPPELLPEPERQHPQSETAPDDDGAYRMCRTRSVKRRLDLSEADFFLQEDGSQGEEEEEEAEGEGADGEDWMPASKKAKTKKAALAVAPETTEPPAESADGSVAPTVPQKPKRKPRKKAVKNAQTVTGADTPVTNVDAAVPQAGVPFAATATLVASASVTPGDAPGDALVDKSPSVYCSLPSQTGTICPPKPKPAANARGVDVIVIDDDDEPVMGGQPMTGVRPVTNIGVRPVTNVGVRPVTNVGVRPVTNVGVRQVTNVGVRPVTNVGVRPVTNSVVRLPVGNSVDAGNRRFTVGGNVRAVPTVRKLSLGETVPNATDSGGDSLLQKLQLAGVSVSKIAPKRPAVRVINCSNTQPVQHSLELNDYIQNVVTEYRADNAKNPTVPAVSSAPFVLYSKTNESGRKVVQKLVGPQAEKLLASRTSGAAARPPGAAVLPPRKTYPGPQSLHRGMPAANARGAANVPRTAANVVQTGPNPAPAFRGVGRGRGRGRGAGRGGVRPPNMTPVKQIGTQPVGPRGTFNSPVRLSSPRNVNGSPGQQQFGSPMQQQLNPQAPQQHLYNSPTHQQFSFPTQPQFGTPTQGTPTQQQFGSPTHGIPMQQQFSSPTQQQFGTSTHGTPTHGTPTHGTPTHQQFGTSAQQQFGTPTQQFGTPNQQQFGSPNQQQFGTPAHQQFGSPTQPQFGSPTQHHLSPPTQQQYISPTQQQFMAPAQHSANPADQTYVTVAAYPPPVQAPQYVQQPFINVVQAGAPPSQDLISFDQQQQQQQAFAQQQAFPQQQPFGQQQFAPQQQQPFGLHQQHFPQQQQRSFGQQQQTFAGPHYVLVHPQPPQNAFSQHGYPAPQPPNPPPIYVNNYYVTNSTSLTSNVSNVNNSSHVNNNMLVLHAPGAGVGNAAPAPPGRVSDVGQPPDVIVLGDDESGRGRTVGGRQQLPMRRAITETVVISDDEDVAVVSTPMRQLINSIVATNVPDVGMRYARILPDGRKEVLSDEQVQRIRLENGGNLF